MKKVLLLIFCVLMLVEIDSSKTFALDINVTNSSHSLSNYTEEKLNSATIAKHADSYASSNESFSFTFAVTDVQESVSWTLNNYHDLVGSDSKKQESNISNIQFSPAGNTATVTGTLHQDSYRLVFTIQATDGVYIDNIGVNAVYAITIMNQDKVKEENNNEEAPAPAPIPDDGYDSTENETTTKTSERLHVGIVEAVQLDDDKLQKIADNIGIDKNELHMLTNADFDNSEPPEPTQSMRDEVASDSYEFAAKLNTINVKEDGWYVFKVTVSDDLVGTKVSDLKLYYADEDEFSGASASLAFFGLMPAINGITGSLEVSNMLGVKLDTLPKQFLATMFLSASKSITVYIVRILLLLLGGCNVGIGIAGAVVVGVVAVKFFRKRK